MKDNVSEKLRKPNKEHVIVQIWKINLSVTRKSENKTFMQEPEMERVNYVYDEEYQKLCLVD